MVYTTFWPGDARLAITISIMFEANGQPISGAGGPITEPIKPGYPDLATNTYFEYGMREGIPHLLDLFDRSKIQVSAFMIGQAVEKTRSWHARLLSVGTRWPPMGVPGSRSTRCHAKRSAPLSRIRLKVLSVRRDRSQSGTTATGFGTASTRWNSCKNWDLSTTLTT
jgi:hypothetical protein